MSAYVVDRDTIRYLVACATFTPESLRAMTLQRVPEDIGQILWDENIRSIHARYPDTIDDPDNMPGPIGESFEYKHVETPHGWRPDPAQGFQTCRCYCYQTCETDDFEESIAFEIILAIRSNLEALIPGYEEAVWGAPVIGKRDPNVISIMDMVRK